MSDTAGGSIVLFDGVCNLCNGYIRFIIDRDPQSRFRFAALQSETGKELTLKYSLPGDGRTVILIEGGRVYLRSAAVLRVLRRLTGVWPCFYAFIVVPPFLRNAVYDLVARNRYRWFGKRDVCRMPTASDEERFL